jgi:hypothetical protein
MAALLFPLGRLLDPTIFRHLPADGFRKGAASDSGGPGGPKQSYPWATGNGKSQTITNRLPAAGRRILFVAEKKAALEVVKRRLEEVGLGHLAIDLHRAYR